jgi:ubiquinone/menaquinone biosynthesis C-methylase UbiE
MTNSFNDQQILKQKQYNNADKLSARIRLHRDFGSTKQSIWDWFFAIALQEIPAQADVLEVGTGRGDVWHENQHRIPVGWHITLTDFSDGMLADNKTFLGELAARMTYNIVDVQDIPYPDNSFDVVFANMMLYHVPHRPQAIAELRRVLKPDGVLFAMTNGGNHMDEIRQIAHQVDEIQQWQSVFKDTFSLQNGEAQLHQHFANVRMEMFDSHLWVTEAQPLIDYIASMLSIDGEKVIAEHEAAIRADIEQRIAADGGIRIQKETGTFIAKG